MTVSIKKLNFGKFTIAALVGASALAALFVFSQSAPQQAALKVNDVVLPVVEHAANAFIVEEDGQMLEVPSGGPTVEAKPIALIQPDRLARMKPQ